MQRKSLFITTILYFSTSILNADICSHNYTTNRLAYRNITHNQLDLTKFADLEEQKLTFNGHEFIFKRETRSYFCGCRQFENIRFYYPSDLICVYTYEEPDPILILKEHFSFETPLPKKKLNIITLDSYLPQSAIPFHEIGNFVNHLRSCLSKPWHFLHLKNDPIVLSPPLTQLETRAQNILSDGISQSEKLGGKWLKWAENMNREILPPLLYEEGKKWIQTHPSLRQIEKGLEALKNTSISLEYKALIEKLKNYGFHNSLTLKEVYIKVQGTPSEKDFLSLFYKVNQPLVSDMVLESCKNGLNRESAFDRLLAIHILEEFARIIPYLDQESSSTLKNKSAAFYLENMLSNEASQIVRYRRYPSNPSVFLFENFTAVYHDRYSTINQLTKAQLDKIYKERSAALEAQLNYELPVEKKIKQLIGQEEFGKLLNSQKPNFFDRRRGEEIVLMIDQALFCLKCSKKHPGDHINKDEIWHSYFEENNTKKNFFFSTPESPYAPLLTWYLVIGLINEYDNFFVPLSNLSTLE